ncbi:MAG TPA: hypothetical protein VGB26_10040 [Nitrospiria bacterium]|jgi:hypothetical protein
MAEGHPKERVNDQRKNNQERRKPGKDSPFKGKVKPVLENTYPSEQKPTNQKNCSEDPSRSIDFGKKYKMLSNGHPDPEKRQYSRYETVANGKLPEQ